MSTNATRRGFLKLGTAVIGGMAITRYAEPIIQLADRLEWVEDKGDYCIIRVPDFKTFANESITKPAIFILGELAIVRSVRVEGFANIYAPKGGRVMDSLFDSSRMVVKKERPVVNLNAKDTIISDCQFIGNGFGSALQITNNGLIATAPRRT